MELEWKKDRGMRESQETVNERKKRWKIENPEAYRAMRDREKERKKERRKAGEKVDAPYKPVSELTPEQLEKRREQTREKMRRYRAKKALEAQQAGKPQASGYYPDQSAGFAEAVSEAHSDRIGIVTLHGQDVDFNTAWGFADSDLRERLITQLPLATDQELLNAYCKLHKERYGEEFDF